MKKFGSYDAESHMETGRVWDFIFMFLFLDFLFLILIYWKLFVFRFLLNHPHPILIMLPNNINRIFIRHADIHIDICTTCLKSIADGFEMKPSEKNCNQHWRQMGKCHSIHECLARQWDGKRRKKKMKKICIPAIAAACN